MRSPSHRLRSGLAGTLVVLFLALSFNAYACLVPLFNASSAAMTSGCSTPDEQPVRQFCDTFTTLGLQTATDYHASVDIDAPIVSPAEATPQAWLMSLSIWTPFIERYPAQGPPQDDLIRTTVLRI